VSDFLETRLLQLQQKCYVGTHASFSKSAEVQTVASQLTLYTFTACCNTATLRLFENRVLRTMVGPRRDEVMRGWRKLHNEELRDLYSSDVQVKEDEVGETRRTNGRGTLIGYWQESQREKDR
jgi:hypothetical protein